MACSTGGLSGLVGRGPSGTGAALAVSGAGRSVAFGGTVSSGPGGGAVAAAWSGISSTPSASTGAAPTRPAVAVRAKGSRGATSGVSPGATGITAVSEGVTTSVRPGARGASGARGVGLAIFLAATTGSGSVGIVGRLGRPVCSGAGSGGYGCRVGARAPSWGV